MSYKKRNKNNKRQSKFMVALCAAMVLSTSQLAISAIPQLANNHVYAAEVGVENMSENDKAIQERKLLSESARND